MKKIVLITLSLIALSFSQSLLATRYPMGLARPTNGTQARLGGIGVGLDDANLGMSMNPANLGNVRQSVYSLSIQGEFNHLAYDTSSVTLGRFSPLQLSFAFPLGKLGTVAASFQSISSNEFTYIQKVPLISNSSDTLMITQGKGVETATTSWELGYGFEFSKWLSVGITYQRYNYNFTSTNILLNDDTLTNGTPIETSSSMEKIEVKQGASVIRLGLSGAGEKLSYGLTGTFPIVHDAPTTYSITQISDAQEAKNPHYEDVIKRTFVLQLPPSAAVGAGWKFNDKIRIGGDFGMTYWKAFWTDIPANALTTYQYQNTVKFAIGTEFIPAANILAPKYWETIRYGGGFRYETLPVKGDKEIALTLSLGFPLGAMGFVDFAVEGGMRRSDLFSTTEENFIRFTLSTGGGRPWKKKGNSVY